MTKGGETLRLGVAPRAAKALCVFVHGRGWTPARLALEAVDRLTVPGIAYALPAAPGLSWYAARAVDSMTDDTAREVADAIAQVSGVIHALRAEAPNVPLVLAGLSQGACVALELAFRGGAGGAVDAVVALTGCRVGRASDPRPMDLPRGLPVYLSGGNADPSTPVQAFAEAVAELGQAGAALRADLFPDRGHQMSEPEIGMLDWFLADAVSCVPPQFGATR